jgi:steroid 5-alpha reductase family enzyme
MESIQKFYIEPLASAIACSKTAADFSAQADCWFQESFTASFATAIGVGLFCFIASRVTGNDSYVDRLWSVVPVVYAWIFTLWPNKTYPKSAPVPVLGGIPEGKLYTLHLFALLITVWGIRLSYNFFRKGGYAKGGEDYRWEVIRAHPAFKGVLGRILWLLFSFAFISIWQSIILWGIATPLYWIPPAQLASGPDFILAAAFLLLLTWETTADQQQWNFQNEKQNKLPRRAEAEDDYRRGFRTRGLWSRSRKPNVWSEMQMWVVIYGTSLSYAKGINVTMLGVILLASLLIPAAFFTESISSSKYPCYSVYKKHVPMFVPRLTSPQPQLNEDFALFEQRQKANGSKKTA